MAKVLVLYYSAYGHIEAMANAVAAGARDAGALVDVKRVPELVPADVAKASHYKLDQVAEGGRACQLRCRDRRHRNALRPNVFADGQLPRPGRWPLDEGRIARQGGRRLHGHRTQHGGQETTLFSIITNLLHFGMTVVGLNYGFAGQMKLDEVTGGSPYGATTITGGDGSRLPSGNELAGARYQGRVIAEAAKKLHG